MTDCGARGFCEVRGDGLMRVEIRYPEGHHWQGCVHTTVLCERCRGLETAKGRDVTVIGEAFPEVVK